MNLSTSLQITQKGEDEVKHRTYKLCMKKRSVLLLLETPKPFEYVLAKSVFPQNEIIEEIEALIQARFISLSGDALALSSRAISPAAIESLSGSLHLDEDIVLSEAKFMLNDFSVDSFGIESQAFVEAIRACQGVNDLELCLSEIFAATKEKCPDRLPILLGLIKKANETA